MMLKPSRWLVQPVEEARHRVRHYERNDVHVTIKPGADGMATIWDKDILILCDQPARRSPKPGPAISRTVHLTAYDVLVVTNRGTGGRAYDLLAAAFERLKGTVIQTDIRTNGLNGAFHAGPIVFHRPIENIRYKEIPIGMPVGL